MRAKKQPSFHIWQQTDWPNFTWNSAAIVEPVATLARLHGELHGRMSMLGFDVKSRAQLAAMTEELTGSSGIEGVVLDARSVRSSIAKRMGIEEDGLLSDDHYVEGLVDVMFDAVTACKKPLTASRLFDWHAALFPTHRSGKHKITVAHWRKGEEPMQVVSGAWGHEKVHYEAPPSAMVPPEMKRLLAWCNKAPHSPFLMAAVAHLWFLTIHPFDDGNGRIGRTLADLFLSRLDHSARYYSMSAEINRRKKDYYDVLERTQKGGMDITEWILWFLDCLKKAIERALSMLDKTLEKALFWDRFREVPVNERQRKVINRLWDGFDGHLSTSKWAKMCHCSQDTALRDINSLVSKGMLRAASSGGRSAHYLLPE